MSAYVELNATTKEVFKANNDELTQLVDKALFDMIHDTFSRFKDPSAPRKITIDLTFVRIDDEVNVTWKVTPKPAPYEKKPEPKSKPVPQGQTSLGLENASEIDEKTGEVIE